jgi:hypothetical protein
MEGLKARPINFSERLLHIALWIGLSALYLISTPYSQRFALGWYRTRLRRLKCLFPSLDISICIKFLSASESGFIWSDYED